MAGHSVPHSADEWDGCMAAGKVLWRVSPTDSWWVARTAAQWEKSLASESAARSDVREVGGKAMRFAVQLASKMAVVRAVRLGGS